MEYTDCWCYTPNSLTSPCATTATVKAVLMSWQQYISTDKTKESTLLYKQFPIYVSTHIYRGNLANTLEPLLSGLMTGCHWPDNKKSRIIEDDPKRPVNTPVLKVKIIWQITSYSTLFILKSNTGNCFYLLPYVRLLGIFHDKVRQKTLFRTTRFRLFNRSLAIFFLGVDIRPAICSQLRPRTESGEELHTGERHG
jgi:hypothetical protein